MTICRPVGLASATSMCMTFSSPALTPTPPQNKVLKHFLGICKICLGCGNVKVRRRWLGVRGFYPSYSCSCAGCACMCQCAHIRGCRWWRWHVANSGTMRRSSPVSYAHAQLLAVPRRHTRTRHFPCGPIGIWHCHCDEALRALWSSLQCVTIFADVHAACMVS